MVKVLVVGQTPPPYHGQAIMIDNLLRAKYPNVKLFHVKLAFSRDIEEVGKFRFSKILHLVSVITRILVGRIRFGTRILYYPPAGPNKIAAFRDITILIATRWLFQKTVFHFHASGLSELYPTLNFAERFLFRLAYFRPDVAVLVSRLAPDDGRAVMAKKQYIVPNGIEDVYEKFRCSKENPSCILYVGMLHESKGLLVLLEACSLLVQRGLDFMVNLMGKFTSGQFEKRVHSFLLQRDLTSRVRFLGVLTGDKKYEVFSRADIFCFPTFYESEAFGVVLLEAMQFGLPLVATRWRGVSEAVQDGISGFLVETRNEKQLAEKLEWLLRNRTEAERMGQRGREIFLREHTLDKHQRRMEEVFESLSEPISDK